jgi:predicted O-methyltransferase YrrM
VDLSYCPELEELSRSGRAIGKSGRVFEVGSLSTPNNLCVLRSLMLATNPARTLEVGLSYGGSAMAIAASHRDLGHDPQHQHVAIDPYQEGRWDGCGVLSLDRAGLAGFVDVRRQLSANALAVLDGEGSAFGLIYIDGSHLFEDVFVDAYFALRLLTQGGIVLFDDCTIDHVAKVLAFITANCRLWVEEVDLSPYHADGGSFRYQVARRLGRVQLRAFRRIGEGRSLAPSDLALHRF